MQNLVELRRGNPHYSCLFVNHLLLNHVHRHLKGSKTGTLSDPALEHPKMSFLDGELDVLHVAEMLLKLQTDSVQLLVDFRHGSLKGLEILVLFGLGGLIERVRCTYSGDHILALGVDEPLSVEFVVSVGRVAGEGYSGS